MTIEDLVRTSLSDEVGRVPQLDGLLQAAVDRGRRRRRARRVITACTGAVTAGALAVAGVVVAGHSGRQDQVLQPAGPGDLSDAAAPWWDSWTLDRHNGPVSADFLAAARPTYDGDSGPEHIRVYATGTTADGTNFVIYLDRHDGHQPQWLQGWDGAPDFGQAVDGVDSGTTWMSEVTPTKAVHDDTTGTGGNQQWLVVVGRPGTTRIDYSADGHSWVGMDVRQGIGVLLLPQGFPPAAAQVRLADDAGFYASGAPAAAGAKNAGG